MLGRLVTIGKNSLKRRNFIVMANKVASRINERKFRKPAAALAWCREQSEDCDAFLKSLDAELYEETQQAAREIEHHCQAKLAGINFNLGGGGNYPLLYFLTRYMNPTNVVETGVAAGWSSQAILAALNRNGKLGRLYSSDFPYFRYDNPEELIGVVVDDKLRANWNLNVAGDRYSLPKIVEEVEEIDLFHYDSDKSYVGRAFALNAIESSLSEKAVVIFDDIQDNTHFQNYVTENEHAYKVFEFQGKYVGLIGSSLINS